MTSDIYGNTGLSTPKRLMGGLWGGIGGSITDQGDLHAALVGKASVDDPRIASPLFVGHDAPAFSGAFLWVQTGLGDGTGVTLWVEDGL